MTERKWRARSASDRTDDWPFWYVTDDMPQDRNKTLEAIEIATGRKVTGMPLVSRTGAEALATVLNTPISENGMS